MTCFDFFDRFRTIALFHVFIHASIQRVFWQHIIASRSTAADHAGDGRGVEKKRIGEMRDDGRLTLS